MKKKFHLSILIAGGIIGLAAVLLTLLGNPANMGFCIACFERDIAGALGMHGAAKVQYLRPEIPGLVLGAFLAALIGREFKPRSGSSPVIRFLLGAAVMIGALVFLGCPLRMVLRLAGGDLNALVALLGFVPGIAVGVWFLNRGFTLRRAYPAAKTEGGAFPVVMLALMALALLVPSILKVSTEGPGSMHAPAILAFVIAIAAGIAAQKARLCMVGGFRDLILFRDGHLLYGFGAIFLVVLIGNLITSKFNLGFTSQPVAHSAHVWNFLGMALVGWGSVLLGGCPLRQLVLAGEGNSDSAITVYGMICGAALSHNFSLAGAAASADSVGGVGLNGKIAVIIGIAVLLAVSVLYTFHKKEAAK